MQQMVPVCRERVLPALWHTSERAGIALSPDALLFAAFLHCALCNVQCAVSNARNWPPLFPFAPLPLLLLLPLLLAGSKKALGLSQKCAPKVSSCPKRSGRPANWPLGHTSTPTSQLERRSLSSAQLELAATLGPKLSEREANQRHSAADQLACRQS